MADLDKLADLIADDVAATLKEPDEDERLQLLRDLAVTTFTLAYETTGGGAAGATHATPFAGSLGPAFGLLQPDGTDVQHERMTQVIAHAARNATVHAAGGDDARFEWRTMRDDRVRDLHQPLDGQVRAAGQTFDVGGHPLRFPGEPVGPPEVWINCRCQLVLATSLKAAADPPKGVVVVARPADPASLAVEGGLPPDELHVTIGFYGDADVLDPEVGRLLEYFVTNRSLDADASVGGRGVIGGDDPPATVLLLESPDLATLRSTLEQVASPDGTHPHFTPHMTLGYGVPMPDSVPPSVKLNRVELWRAGERIGGPVPAEQDPELTAASDKPWSDFSAADYSIEQWRRACCLTMPGGDPESKSTYKLPIKEPGGALNRNGVHAAASRFGSTEAPPEAKAKAKAKIRGAYRQLGEEVPDSLKADAASESLLAWGPSTSAPGTHDAPGWLTNPKETQRLRTYWTKGEGAGKIGWGSPGDLTRCARHLAKYVEPNYVWGTCQNLHYEALGYWNPESEPGGRTASIDEINDAIAAVFAAATDLEELMPPPRALFEDPGLDAPTPLTVVSAGDYDEVIGHLAAPWDTCHVGISGSCVNPPRSATNYAHFRTGEVETDAGPVSVGHITAGTGHAPTDLTAADTVAHYDNTGTVVADVAVGEDDHGIWAHGIVRPGVTDDQKYALRAGAPSGDWRRLGGNLELVGALIVNVPGFPIPRPELAASAGRDLALVAAGVVTTDPNAISEDRIVVAVSRALDEREAAQQRRARAAALLAAMNAERADQLVAAVGH